MPRRTKIVATMGLATDEKHVMDDMIQAGIIDPAKVTKGALANAASIAAMILTTEALITDLPGKNGSTLPGGMPDY